MVFIPGIRFALLAQSLIPQEEKECEEIVNCIAIMRPMPYTILATMQWAHSLNAGRELLSEPAPRLPMANFRTNVRLWRFYVLYMEHIDKSREMW